MRGGADAARPRARLGTPPPGRRPDAPRHACASLLARGDPAPCWPALPVERRRPCSRGDRGRRHRGACCAPGATARARRPRRRPGVRSSGGRAPDAPRPLPRGAEPERALARRRAAPHHRRPAHAQRATGVCMPVAWRLVSTACIGYSGGRRMIPPTCWCSRRARGAVRPCAAMVVRVNGGGGRCGHSTDLGDDAGNAPGADDAQ